MNKLVSKYVGLISKNKMTKNEIDGMRKALGRSSRLNDDERQVILNALSLQVSKSGGIKITKEHTHQGLEYLKSLAWTPKGKVRETKNNPFGYRERAILGEFKEFRLVDVEGISNGFGEVWYFQAVWKVIGKTGSFTYVQGHIWDGIQVIG